MKKTYLVTGITKLGKKFRLEYSRYPYMINFYRCNVWEVKNGKRKLIQRIYN